MALLRNTILQGSLIISEANFNRVFPSLNGYRQWLINVSRSDFEKTVSAILENGWADEGMDVEYSSTILQNLLAVQNTYLKAFQALGALGLLLGTFGLAVVQTRSIMERKKELGLFQALGFSRYRIATILMIESLMLLAGGLALGIVGSLVALIPTFIAGSIQPDLREPAVMLGIVALLEFPQAFMRSPKR